MTATVHHPPTVPAPIFGRCEPDGPPCEVPATLVVTTYPRGQHPVEQPACLGHARDEVARLMAPNGPATPFRVDPLSDVERRHAHLAEVLHLPPRDQRAARREAFRKLIAAAIYDTGDVWVCYSEPGEGAEVHRTAGTNSGRALELLERHEQVAPQLNHWVEDGNGKRVDPPC